MKLLPTSSFWSASLTLFALTSPSVVHVVDAGAAAAAANALKDMDYRYFVAGGVCAATSHGLTTPVDVVKTQIQAKPKDFEGLSLLSSALKVIKEQGPQALLAGLGPTVIGYGVEGAMKFGVYEILKPVFYEAVFGGVGDTTTAYIMASVIAGAIASLLLCPMESTRIRQVTDPAYKDKGLMVALPKLIQEDGLWNLFAGFRAMLAKQVPYTMAKQVSFDIVASMLYRILSNGGAAAVAEGAEGVEAAIVKPLLTGDALKWVVSVCSAFIASLFACIFSQPGDMILTETYKSAKPGPFGVVVQNIWGQGGVPAFFTGTGARIVHVGLIITSQLVIYDIVKQALGLPATGSH
eukprot:CAMPEP_0194049630 /NCGR_PEP_ID=MMETSP0009_2-20130614/30797_1 /TAXON_ID=210454 /ORGANISM="Grammatophora oceanica, Strain CCMP 410" /LENGTH=350 /DNA_ID=CAMNT_0038695831 /DNA_START=115 /DNA_END=1167 /DNA_ORIENTATION=-